MTYKDLFGNYLRTVKEICITAPFIRQPYQIRLKSQKSERISPFWVGGYPPFSAIKDMCSSWKKAADYNIAFYCVMFGGFQYYQSQQLLSEVRRTEVIRYILSSDPTNKAMIEKIDTVFREKGVDAIYNQVK